MKPPPLLEKTASTLLLGSGSLRVTSSPRWLLVRFDRRHWVLSSAIVGGGRRLAKGVAWHEVRDKDLPASIDPVRLLRRRLAERGLSETVGLLTSRDLRRHVVSEQRYGDVSAQAVATVGLGNALRVGDAPAGHGHVGTINILCRVSEPLSESAQIEALCLVAEARALVLMEAGIASGRSGLPSTGTGTDCIVLASPLATGKQRYAGKHTPVGHVVGAAVVKALSQGVSAWRTEP